MINSTEKEIITEYTHLSLDEKEFPNICDCEFTPYELWDDGYEEESWHFLRKCGVCGNKWYSLHCPHDGHQNKCGCGALAPQITNYNYGDK